MLTNLNTKILLKIINYPTYFKLNINYGIIIIIIYLIVKMLTITLNQK